MAGSPKKRSRIERERALLREPQTLDLICESVAQTGSLGKWCQQHDLSFRNVYGWLHGDKERLSVYTKALEVRQSRLTDKVTDKMETMIDSDIRKAFKGKRMLPVHRLPDSVAGALTEISDSPRGGVKLKLVSPDRSAELLGRHLGMFRDKVEISGEVGLSTRLAAARARIAAKK